MPTITNHDRALKRTRTCFIYNDPQVLRTSAKRIKSMRRGQTITIDMMSRDALEELMDSYSENRYEIIGNSFENSDIFYEVTVRRYTLLEQLFGNKTRRAAARQAMRCSVEENCPW